MGGCPGQDALGNPERRCVAGHHQIERDDPEAALGIIGEDPRAAEVAREAKARLRRAIDGLTAGS